MTNILFHFRSLVFAIAVLFVMLSYALEIINVHDYTGLILFAILFLMTIYIAQRLGKKFIYTFTPLGIFTSSAIMLYFIDPTWERIVFALISSFIYYIALLAITRMAIHIHDDTARTLFAISLMVMLFFFYASAYGVYINFDILLWQFLLVIITTIFLATFVSLYTYKTQKSYVLIYSMIIAFSMAQIAWMINFWPFGYLINAVISIIFYYILWDLSFTAFIDNLSKNRVMLNIIIGAVLIILVLFTSQWVLI